LNHLLLGKTVAFDVAAGNTDTFPGKDHVYVHAINPDLGIIGHPGEISMLFNPEREISALVKLVTADFPFDDSKRCVKKITCSLSPERDLAADRGTLADSECRIGLFRHTLYGIVARDLLHDINRFGELVPALSHAHVNDHLVNKDFAHRIHSSIPHSARAGVSRPTM